MPSTADEKQDESPSFSTAASMEHMASVRELVIVLEREIDRMLDRLRAVFMLRDIEQLNVAETAHLLNLARVDCQDPPPSMA
jgi:DNA-directed RNA polymerase specialized sigma24 family protein